jgi:hypothetical protein
LQCRQGTYASHCLAAWRRLKCGDKGYHLSIRDLTREGFAVAPSYRCLARRRGPRADDDEGGRGLGPLVDPPLNQTKTRLALPENPRGILPPPRGTEGDAGR